MIYGMKWKERWIKLFGIFLYWYILKLELILGIDISYVFVLYIMWLL